MILVVIVIVIVVIVVVVIIIIISIIIITISIIVVAIAIVTVTVATYSSRLIITVHRGRHGVLPCEPRGSGRVAAGRGCSSLVTIIVIIMVRW